MDGAGAQAAMPTPDRLAQPTLPAQPGQADIGAQVYWLSCLPCHGDKGQGLTQEFIETYPEEERNCWASGCHGKNPYESGFTIPRAIPALIGKGALQKFTTAAALRSYIRAAMPYWNPGSLTDDESWQVTAFLLRENQLWDARQDLTEENARAIFIALPSASPTPAGLPARRLPSTVTWIILAAFTVAGILFLLRRFTSQGEEQP